MNLRTPGQPRPSLEFVLPPPPVVPGDRVPVRKSAVTEPLKFLLIGDENRNRRLLAFGLCDCSMEACGVQTPDDLQTLGALGKFGVGMLDWEMKAHDASSLLSALRTIEPELPLVVLVSDETEQAAAQAAGATACVMKPVDVDRLQSILRQQARSPESNRGAAALSPTPAPRGVQGSSKGQFTSQNPTVKRILETAWRVAPTTASVLLLGENGTGKTILAEAIHQRSNRAKEPFVTVNCPCLKRELLESELFGHVRGSFTGAISDAMGKVAAAEGGTLFLDEVGDLPLDIQPKLLRLLQDRVYERVGESRSRQANVRIIAATNRNLAAEVKAGRFREDLYYRLNVISLEMPPLRERPEDILDAANHLLRSIGDDLHREFRGFTPLAGEALQSYDWPGNLRELRNVVERAAILSDRDILDLADFEIPTSTHAATPQVGSYVSLAKIEEEHIRQVIERTTTLEHAARILGIDKSTLYRKRKRQHSPLSDFEFANETAACAG